VCECVCVCELAPLRSARVLALRSAALRSAQGLPHWRYMRVKRKRGQTKCAACRASAYIAECGDEHLATVIKMHLPPHTCGTSSPLDASHTSPPPPLDASHTSPPPPLDASHTSPPPPLDASRTSPPPPPPPPEADAALSLKAIDVIAFNASAERKFVELARRLCPCPVSYLVREAAYMLDVSIETTKRYLLKHSASNAEFVVMRGVVMLRKRD
jgi:hypothetical protein